MGHSDETVMSSKSKKEKEKKRDSEGCCLALNETPDVTQNRTNPTVMETSSGHVLHSHGDRK